MKQSWLMAQTWRHILFLNYKVDADWLRPHLPKAIELDTYGGQAYLSIVPFRMEGIRFRFTPVLPLSSMWELNLRTYVKVGGRRGIYFFTLDTDHLLGEFIARSFFHLNYRFKSMRAHKEGQDYIFDAGKTFFMKTKVTSVPLVTSDYHDWLVERYSLFTTNKDLIYRGDVLHSPWSLSFARLETMKEGLIEEFLPNAPVELESVFYSEELPVRFIPFSKL